MIQLDRERQAESRPPRLGFVGLGWIGRMRMALALEGGAAVADCLCDPADEAYREAMKGVASAARAASLDALLDRDLDGVVIATPNALHEEQAIAALEAGLAVFCQKPLAPSASAARRIVDAARANDQLLAVDWSYRHVAGMRRVKELTTSGALGEVTAIELTFHNAYGPDGGWFYERSLAGGGCLVDLGVHLLDQAMELVPREELRVASSRVFSAGRELSADPGSPAEDFVWTTLRSDRGVAVRVACSWRAHTGADCEIGVRVHGSDGGVSVRNIDGSFFDFETRRQRGASEEVVCREGDEWCGGAIREWTRRLAAGEGFDPEVEQAVRVAELVESIYAASVGNRGAGARSSCVS